MIRLWKGYHHPELPDLLSRCLRRREPLILCPPLLADFRFLGALPLGREPRLELVGDWDADHRKGVAEALRNGGGSRICAASWDLGVFTSGSGSGRPRLVLYSRANVEASIEAILSVFGSGRIGNVFCYPQPFHCFGLVLGYLLPLLKGLAAVYPRGRYSGASHELWLEGAGPGTLTLGTPTHFHDLSGRVRAAGRAPAPSYASIAGGARVSRALWLGMRDVLRIEAPSIGYGASEASPGIMHHPPGREPRECGEIGHCLPGVQVRLLPGRGLEFDGPNRCVAIIEDGMLAPEGPILLTDEVRQREDGMHVHHGRTELILNRGGTKVSLELIEDALRSELGLETLCVAVPDSRLGEDLGLLLKSSQQARNEAGAIERISRILLQRFDLRLDPTRFREVEEFPLTGSAKADRRKASSILPNTGPGVKPGARPGEWP